MSRLQEIHDELMREQERALNARYQPLEDYALDVRADKAREILNTAVSVAIGRLRFLLAQEQPKP